MPLPPRSYFFLPEIAERWGTTPLDVASYAHGGLIQLCVMVVSKLIEAGMYEGEGRDWYRIPTRHEFFNGPLPLIPRDVWPIIERRVGEVARFDAPGDEYIEIADGHAPIKVGLHQLLVMREERDRFEAEYGIAVAQKAPPPPPSSEFTHTGDYTRVTLSGGEFTLGLTQASILRELHAAALRGEPWLNHQELLQAAGSKSARLVDVFKSQKDWRKLIALDGRGRCKLNVVARPPSKSRQQAFRRALSTPARNFRKEAVENGGR